ncbi:DUF433 domain-containing protein [Leptolyngbya sp. PCC 6406]|uniref:DUF433 domain-containing protein n=1 Tax=Leptolyngbya sp. PCC 6406 TaxID=1173264 RepID=UPI0002ACB3B9|nr:DUF433 domain-containing protein [Leptolyngbya sp. PCC 6406]
MDTVSTIAEHIEITPGVCGGKPRIAGHRIRVQDIAAWHEQMNLSPDAFLPMKLFITIPAFPWRISMRRWRIITTIGKRFRLISELGKG